MQKRVLYIVLCFCLTVFVLTGCVRTNEESTQIKNTSETVNNAVELVVEDTKEELILDSSKDAITAEVSGGSTEDVAEVEETIESADTEEPESKISEEDSEFNANLSEYLASVNSNAYGSEKHGKYKSCYYAVDINEDGFPEVFQYLYDDVTADFRDVYLIRYFMHKGWSEKEHRYVYGTGVDMFRVSEYCLMSASFGSPEIDMSYTKNTENILYSGAVTSNKDGKETTFKQLQIFRDAEVLFGGSAKMERSPAANDQWIVTYLTFDASYRIYEDEEHFNNFDSGSTYETTIRFGTDELWSTWQEAVEHLGELP